MTPRSIWFERGEVRITDQTLLPGEVRVLTIASPEGMWEAIRSLRIRGAPAIGIGAAFGLWLGIKEQPGRSGADLWPTVERVSAYLETARPTAVNLAWAIDRVRRRLESERGRAASDFKGIALAEARRILEEDALVCQEIGNHGAPLLHDHTSVLTHCNAGALATGGIGTALAPIIIAAQRGLTLHVYVGETRPLFQGARLTAWELRENRVAATVICDSAAASLMRQGRIQAVLVGADRVAANGDVANKIGTYGLAVLAKAHGIPFYVAAPRSSVDLALATGEAIPIEERPGEEITRPFGHQVAPEGVGTLNPAFDVTPADYVTAFITECGPVAPPFGPGLRHLFERPLAEPADLRLSGSPA